MYLSRIDIFGFKSFATKTKVAFNEGITAIVGPNGCGKTNIVDALRWVLGEQRYSTLRSDKMEDVIFNGTKNRKPIGLAEVSLTIENTKGILPMEYTDVTITRRLFRSGESEYLLNKTVCRLKDIINLFMDTGMGANAYSVIELKMVESILSDKAEERRHLFEEAAGITKYKTKRKEAFRRLEDAQTDLLRVNDIITEVDKTVASLERQAKKAEKYKELNDRFRILETDVLERDYSSLLRRLEPLEARLLETQSSRDTLALQVKQKETLLEELQMSEKDIDQQCVLVRSDLQDVQTKYNDSEQRLVVDIERRRSLEQSIERWDKSIAEEQEKKQQRVLALEEQHRNKELILKEIEAAQRDIDHKKSSHEANEASLTESKLHATAIQSRQVELLHSTSQIKSELERYETNAQTIRTQVLQSEAELAENSAAAEERRRVLFESNQGEVQLKDNVFAAERTFREMEERKKQIKTEMDLLQNKSFEIQNQIGERMTKIDFLNSLVDRFEGYSESVQYLLTQSDWSLSRRTTVADVVNARDDLRVAIEASLGDEAHYIIVNDIAEAVSGIHRLKSTQKGKATFVCLSRIPEVQAVPFPIAGDGIVGWAINLVQFTDEYQKLFRFLLRHVLIVRDEQVAHTCIREYPQLKCVTLEGDLFQSSGVIRGGNHRQDEGGLIGKREQIATLNEQVEQLKITLLENQSLLSAMNDEYNNIDVVAYAEQMTRSQQKLSTLERECAQMIFEIEKYDRTVEKLQVSLASMAQQLTENEAHIREVQPKLDAVLAQQQEFDSLLFDSAELLKQHEAEYNQSFAEINTANIALVEKTAAMKNADNEIERQERAIEETMQTIVRTEEEIRVGKETLLALSDEIDSLEKSLLEMRRQKSEAAFALQKIEEQMRAQREEIERIEHLVRGDRDQHTETLNLVHEIDLKVSEIHQKLESLVVYARDEMQFTLERKYFDDEDVFDLAQAKEEIRIIKGRIQNLGPVNQLAFEEYQEEKNRFDTLMFQRSDLLNAEKTLRDTITEINITAQEKFLETFRLIRENFISIFKSLFEEGDEADLTLRENDDPLEAAIDIIAKPRGKRPHSIEMLSGGEKTLTAIALLFAIYLVKPSPFCILDEVDAPLDDANIDRFIKIIRKFSADTQFIIVTHNKRTMEAADTLYGVTMEEEGISKLVAVKFDEETIARFSKN